MALTKVQQSLFVQNPREYALDLIDEGLIDERTLILVLLKGTSHAYLKEILKANELSPEFL
jgi:hypothetical protein